MMLAGFGIACLCACTDPEAPGGNKGMDPIDAGTTTNGDASVGNQAQAKPTMVAPVTGASRVTSTNYQGRVIVTSPQPAGETSSTNHRANISVTGAQP